VIAVKIAENLEGILFFAAPNSFKTLSNFWFSVVIILTH